MRQTALILATAFGIVVWSAISAINGLLIAYQLRQGNYVGGAVMSVIYLLLPIYMLYWFIRLATVIRNKGRLPEIGLSITFTLFAVLAEPLVLVG